MHGSCSVCPLGVSAVQDANDAWTFTKPDKHYWVLLIRQPLARLISFYVYARHFFDTTFNKELRDNSVGFAACVSEHGYACSWNWQTAMLAASPEVFHGLHEQTGVTVALPPFADAAAQRVAERTNAAAAQYLERAVANLLAMDYLLLTEDAARGFDTFANSTSLSRRNPGPGMRRDRQQEVSGNGQPGGDMVNCARGWTRENLCTAAGIRAREQDKAAWEEDTAKWDAELAVAVAEATERAEAEAAAAEAAATKAAAEAKAKAAAAKAAAAEQAAQEAAAAAAQARAEAEAAAAEQAAVEEAAAAEAAAVAAAEAASAPSPKDAAPTQGEVAAEAAEGPGERASAQEAAAAEPEAGAPAATEPRPTPETPEPSVAEAALGASEAPVAPARALQAEAGTGADAQPKATTRKEEATKVGGEQSGARALAAKKKKKPKKQSKAEIAREKALQIATASIRPKPADAWDTSPCIPIDDCKKAIKADEETLQQVKGAVIADDVLYAVAQWRYAAMMHALQPDGRG